MKSFRYAGAGKPNIVALLLYVLPAAAQAATSTHCLPEEQVIFSCSVGKKVVSICASDTLGRASGTAQYRFGALGKVELKIPAEPQHPTVFSRLGVMRGPAWADTHIRVVNGEYVYTVYEGEGKGWQRSGVLVSKHERTLANLSCVSPKRRLFADVVYSGVEAFADETENQKASWLEAINATQSEGGNSASSPIKLGSARGKNFVLAADFNPGFLLPMAASSGCVVDSPPRYSVQTSFGTIHVDEYTFPYGCFGTAKADALFGVGYLVPPIGVPPLGFRYRKGGRAELLDYLERL
ncbi:hypothetical protein [Achromobacter xylosoxidans]|uniref:hypothetical protein n=1 Tax=Alcaligenes xylosoxydans xylosoxydans TaxID=85698 RepID=UPI000AE4D662|nr:hypothetical protein [Achromobacter xylosoxidans]